MAKKTKAASRKPKAAYKRPKRGRVSLEDFLDGQRKINGSFYEALDKILEALGAASDALAGAGESMAKGTRSEPAGPLAATRKLVEDVPGIDPPGCLPPGGG
jgi:hypothetical protein